MVSSDEALITLRLFGPLRDAVGQAEICLPCAGATVKEALVRFAEERGDAVRPFILDGQGDLWRSVILLLNGEPVGDSAETRLKAGDVISLLLPLAGG
ncbi:MAG: MoaD/ThiS family protein [Armatimonadota bacterium]|nr:MoaD/ThiS family protein [Armatimonadota bacterium]